MSAQKTDTSANVVPPLSQSYAYDPMGNRGSYTDQSGSVTYVVNKLNQYQGKVYSSPGVANQAIPVAPLALGSIYDKNGNLLGDGVNNYVWDADNQLVSVTPVSPSPARRACNSPTTISDAA